MNVVSPLHVENPKNLKYDKIEDLFSSQIVTLPPQNTFRTTNSEGNLVRNKLANLSSFECKIGFLCNFFSKLYKYSNAILKAFNR